MKLALGTVQLGKEYGIQKSRKPEPEESIQLLDYAVKAGINIFDTAAAYGDAESIIGEFLSKRVERSAIAVITKLPPGVLDGIPTGDYQSAIENEIIKSLCRLNTDYLDGLLFHNAKYVFNANAMDALIRVKRSGVTGKAGISVYTPDEAIKALEYDIDIVQLPYNIFDRRLDQLGFFEQSKARGITVFARSPLLQGLLAMAPDRIPENMRFAEPYITEYGKICQHLRLTQLECAIMFVASHKYIDYLLFGVDNKKQLSEVVCAAGKRMDPETYEFLCGKFHDIPDKVIMPYLWPLGV